MARRWVKYLALLVGLTASIGCGGQGDKDKNKDLDRPKPAAEKGP